MQAFSQLESKLGPLPVHTVGGLETEGGKEVENPLNTLDSKMIALSAQEGPTEVEAQIDSKKEIILIETSKSVT